ncbi:hypothetical protein CANINC_004700 [Pichia inconspicua]|uniref:SET domain-containing protein n=1 Tax=Pichia inconspicua TaxID=52247 RepID=A0A4T0WWG2_9ASCO|nr:hypothetical protein CANINC_004700 [[Candida] inconspicua]
MSSSNPATPIAQTDDEATGLLMLFSTQSKKQITTHESTLSGVKSTVIKSPQTVLQTVTIPPPTTSYNTQSISSNESSKSHRRSSSINDNKNHTRVESSIRSPGPASAALARGDSSSKAIVAAAALAAAAATPIPIMHKPLQQTEKHQAERKPTTVKVKEELSQSYTNIKPDETSNATLDETEPEDVEEQGDADIKPESSENHAEPVGQNGVPSYAVGPDAGIIGCVCGYDHDDGLTIQCDKCFRWQHLVCMGFESITDTPDDFQCNLCNKNMKVDVNKAKRIQAAYLKEEKSKRRKSPHVNESEKEVPKNIGAPQFKKKKSDENVETPGTQKHSTLYYPINYFVYRSPTIKSLFNQLPNVLRKEKSIIKIDKGSLSKLVLDSTYLNIKSAADNRSKFLGISKLGLYANKTIKERECVSLVSGEIDTKENYMLDKINRYWLLGCPKPHVIFHPELPIVIDQRGLGNCTRFIRKSCKPNCVVKTILIGKGDIYMGVFATEEIRAEQEITLAWEWDTSHPILKIIKDERSFDTLDNECKITLINSIQAILEHTECACPTNSECVIGKVKKASVYTLRNTRKNNMSGLSPTPHQTHTPIEERLNARNSIILKEMQNEGFVNGEKHVENIIPEDSSETSRRDRTFDLKFNPKCKNSLYNLHILPKQLELFKRYMLEKDSVSSTSNISKHESDMMPIPIPVSSEILKAIEPVKDVNDEKKLFTTKKANGDIKAEERPKVKKFSLADYKRKKTG